MPKTTVITGIAGAGKTAKAMEIIEDRVMSGLSPWKIGFSSFSRAACAEAAERAADIVGIEAGRLQTTGFFRTLHSVVLRCLGIDAKVILDHESAQGQKFMTEVFGTSRGGEAGTLGAKIDEALNWWDAERSRLNRFKNTEQLSHLIDTSTPKDTRRHPVDTTAVDVGAPVSPHKTQGFCNDTEQMFSSYYVYRGSENSERDLQERSRRSENGVFGVDCDDFFQKSYIEYRESESTPKSEMVSIWTKVLSEVSTEPVKPEFLEIVRAYETQKRIFGKLDFHDLCLKFAGIGVDETELTFRETYPEGTVPQEIELWIIDEFQDCSSLLDRCVTRLSEAAGELILLGDRYQSVYGFAGSDWRCMAFREDQAKSEGNRLLLNKSWRNTKPIIEWGEEILRQDRQYEERKPIPRDGEGSVGMIESRLMIEKLRDLGGTDTMVLCRTWHGLGKVKEQLDSLGIPWRSCQEKFRSRWEAPVKIAFVLVMRDLARGHRISEQDWRRVTEEIPQKVDGVEMFVRGVKAKWKKIECSREPVKTVEQIVDWGATDAMVAWVKSGAWRRDAYLLMDTAIEKYGVDEVRNPKLRLGSCHSVKGMQADNVFCLAASTRKANECDFWEDLFLKYVTVTRARFHYRVVVDLLDHARGKPLFLACKPGYWKFDQEMPDVRSGSQGTVQSPQVVDDETGSLGGEIPRRDLRQEGNAGSAAVREREVCCDRDEKAGGRRQGEDSGGHEAEDLEEWWNL